MAIQKRMQVRLDLENLSKNIEDSNILELKCIDRDETIKEFEDFSKKEDKTIY